MTFAEIRNNQTLRMVLQRSWLVVCTVVAIVPYIVTGAWEGISSRLHELRGEVVYFWNRYGLTTFDEIENRTRP